MPLSAPFSIILCDRQSALVAAWRHAFARNSEIAVERGDLLDVEADAYVSPANSYGYMDGGIDYALSGRFPGIERRVQTAISEMGGILPVGQAVVVETGDPFVPYLVASPTMEVPRYVGNTMNAHSAMLALLRVITRFNQDNDGAISSVAIPGLATGVGGMEPEIAATQMAQAYEEWLEGILASGGARDV